MLLPALSTEKAPPQDAQRSALVPGPGNVLQFLQLNTSFCLTSAILNRKNLDGARVVIPGYPHRITQRGNRSQETFSGKNDY